MRDERRVRDRRFEKDAFLSDLRHFARNRVSAAKVHRPFASDGLRSGDIRTARESFQKRIGEADRLRLDHLRLSNSLGLRWWRIAIDDAAGDSRSQRAGVGTEVGMPHQTTRVRLLAPVGQSAVKLQSVHLQAAGSAFGLRRLRQAFVFQNRQRAKFRQRQPQRFLDRGVRQSQVIIGNARQVAAEPRAVEVEGSKRARCLFARRRQEDAGDLIGRDLRFFVAVTNGELLLLGIECRELTVHNRAVGPMQSRFVGLHFARRDSIPAADPQPLQSHIPSFVRQSQTGIHLRLAWRDIDLPALHTAGRIDQQLSLLLIEIRQVVSSTCPSRRFLDGIDIRLAPQLTTDDQFVVPNLEAKRSFEDCLVVGIGDSQREHEVRLGLPREFKLDDRLGRDVEVSANARTLLIR